MTTQPKGQYMNFKGLYQKEYDQLLNANRNFDPKTLMQLAIDYFEWCEANPVNTPEPAKFEGVVHQGDIEKIRPMTVNGLCLFLCISKTTFYNLAKDELYAPVIDFIESVIHEQKYTGGMVGIFHSGMVMRDLGMGEKKDVNVTSSDAMAKLMDDIEGGEDE